MRPVNLIPPDLRRGDSAPLRTGPLVYVLLGALLLVLAGVTMLVLTGNQISDRKSELAQLRHEDAAAKAKAERLAAYTHFQVMSEQRVATVTSLADSRFDWERVMRELSLVLPGNVWLTSLSAGAAPGAVSGESSGGALGTGVLGPSLQLSGCTTGQDAVAGFVTALKDIDGVTRVGLESSAVGGGGAGASESGSGGCQTRDFIATFNLVVAFDAAPAPLTGAEGEVAPEVPPSEGEESSEGESGGG